MKEKDKQQQQQTKKNNNNNNNIVVDRKRQEQQLEQYKNINSNNNDSNSNFIIILIVGVLCRIILYYNGFHHILSERNEISTPITSFKRLTEGLYLNQLGLSPYSGSAFHQPPLLLVLFKAFNDNSSFVLLRPQVLFLVISILSAILLRRIAVLVPRVLPKEMKQSISPNIVVAMFLFNPFSILSDVGMSTIAVNNLVILCALYFTLKGNLFLGVFSVAAAAYLSIYPIILIVPVAFILYRHYQVAASTSVTVFVFKLSILFLFSLVSLLYLSFCLFNSWEFINKCYGFTFLVEDLTPNIGKHRLFWYYFIEVFEHFRKFFLFIFQYNIFIYTIPLGIRLKNHPLFYFWILCAIMATFKSYPALGDTALHISLLPLLYETLKGVKYIFIIVVVGIYVTVLAPILWQMWIYQGTGNANFYYTINLVFTLAQVLLMADALSVLLRLEYLDKFNEKHKQQDEKEIIKNNNNNNDKQEKEKDDVKTLKQD
ncbi:GPI transamidase subunit PIG-U family protein [Cavenderia fasciculata]|uniref:GPI transamidase subunit PIG-U family protein n=1 Tax=Cavenderia fasciculata TaxID=261658 RepID=F4PRB2_CACFS|nr:GPI transamidase subunit PIG-U family protein [Cavenderia fasciculata]EGG21312.1 GPI transamidase subunit PIG-U family protein [Cavenderia fasciculata]|eukprot:XP_004359162.1 GPI transamidase subunit PIG-U family protein [Cavenderia fasciculata]